MWQHVALDRLRRAPYYALASSALAMALAGCTAGSTRPTPDDLSPVSHDSVAAWIRTITPHEPRRYGLRWMYQTQQGRVRGRAAVRLAPPDSLRFDYQAPFGRSGAAVLFGDSVAWAKPPEEVERLIPVAALFWTAIGLPREPPAGVIVRGRREADSRVWQYGDGSDLLTYSEHWVPEHRLRLELRRERRVVGTAEVVFDSVGVPASATMTFPLAAAGFRMTVNEVERLERLDPQVWKEP